MEKADPVYFVPALLIFVGLFLFCLWLDNMFSNVVLWIKTKIPKIIEKEKAKKRLAIIDLELMDADGGDQRNNLRKERKDLIAELKTK